MFKYKNKRQLKKALLKSGMERKEVNAMIKNTGVYAKIFNQPTPDINFEEARKLGKNIYVDTSVLLNKTPRN